jgi:heme exporter protein CcmD
MGGYGLYVWGSYLVTLAALALEVFLVLRRGRTTGNGDGRKGRYQSGQKT